MRSHSDHRLLFDLFDSLSKWISPPYIAQQAYEFCSAVCEKDGDLDECKTLLVSALKLGFRRDDVYLDSLRYPLNHTIHHTRMIDVVFSTGNVDTIADALYVWTLGDTPQLRFHSLSTCAEHLVDLADWEFSSRLRRMTIRAIECIGYQEFERVVVVKLVRLLNKLKIEVHEMEWRSRWTLFLLNVLRSQQGQQNLSSNYWQDVVSMAVQHGLFGLCLGPSDFEIMRSFVETGDWEKLEVWIGLMWVLELPEDGF